MNQTFLQVSPFMNEPSLSAPLAVTPGEPAGIGPELLLLLAMQGFDVPVVAVADPDMMTERAREIGVSIDLRIWQGQTLKAHEPGVLWVQPVTLAEPAQSGVLSTVNAAYVLECLDQAIDGALSGTFSAVVTGPVHKGVINEAGVPFTGHTEHFQRRCGVERVVMMLASARMRVALVTTHLALKEVPEAITTERLQQVSDILLADLQQKFGIEKPRILVAGLNPHAGEGGHMGREEIETIEPFLEAYQAANRDRVELTGPLPADTLFTPKYLQHADAVLAMYHDQGLPVLKFDGFGEAVNITLGLPIIRTSVDHGTAIDLAGSAQADTGSMRCAIEQAALMAQASF